MNIPTNDLAARIRAHVPAELQTLRQWVGWRYADRVHAQTGELKATKVPVQPLTGRAAKSTDSATWTILPAALRGVRPGQGVGFVFAAGGGLVGVDLDGCRDPTTGRLTPFARMVVRLLASYTEVTPSGRGLHVICRGTLPGAHRRRDAPGRAIELYPDGRFFTMTGQPLPGTPGTLRDATSELARLYAHLWPADPPLTFAFPPRASTLTDTAVLRLVSRARNASKFRALWRGDYAAAGCPTESHGDAALLAILGFYTQDAAQLERLFALSGLADAKWHTRPDYRSRTISFVLRRLSARWEGAA